MQPMNTVTQLPSSITHGVWVIERNKGLKAVHALHHTTNPPPRCLVFVNSPHRAKVGTRRRDAQVQSKCFGAGITALAQIRCI